MSTTRKMERTLSSQEVSSFITLIYETIEDQKKWLPVTLKLLSIVGYDGLTIKYTNNCTKNEYIIRHIDSDINIEHRFTDNWLTIYQQENNSDIKASNTSNYIKFESTETIDQPTYVFYRGNSTCRLDLYSYISTSNNPELVKPILSHISRCIGLYESNIMRKRADNFRDMVSNSSKVAILIIDKKRRIIDSNDIVKDFCASNADIIDISDGYLKVLKNGKMISGFVEKTYKSHPNESFSVYLTNDVTDKKFKLCVEPYEYSFFNEPEISKKNCLRVSILPMLSARQYFKQIQKYFCLTKIETELLCLLCEGNTVEEIVILRSKSAHTIRTQIKNLLKKTNSSRQPELIARVLNMCMMDSFQ